MQIYLIYILLTLNSCIIFFKWSQLGAHYFLVYLFKLLYMFRVFFALYGWLSGLQTKQPPIQSEKYQCRIDTVSSPNDGHIFTRNM